MYKTVDFIFMPALFKFFFHKLKGITLQGFSTDERSPASSYILDAYRVNPTRNRNYANAHK